MFESVVVFAALHQWLTFGPVPLPEQVAEGKRLYAQGKGIERTLKDSRSVIGVWFDGRVKDDVESIIWVSPGMASRWLGYLEAQSKWPKSETQRRWDAIRGQVRGRLCFVIRLSAMPRLVGLDMESEGKPTTVDIDNPSFRLTSGPGYSFPRNKMLDRFLRTTKTPSYPQTLSITLPLPDPVAPVESFELAHWQSRDRFRLDRYQWYQDLPLAISFLKPGQEIELDPGYGLGDYGSKWFWVSFDPAQLHACAGGFEVWIATANKERVGSFRF